MTNQENQNLGRRIKGFVDTTGSLLSNPVSLENETPSKGDIDKALEQMGSVYRRSIIEADPGTRHSSLDDNGE